MVLQLLTPYTDPIRLNSYPIEPLKFAHLD